MRRFNYFVVFLLFSTAVPSLFGQNSEGQSASSESARRAVQSLDKMKASPPSCASKGARSITSKSKSVAASAPALPTEEMRALFKEAADRNRSSALRSNVIASYSRLPLSFEANLGQTDEGVKFLSRGLGYALYLTGREAVLSLRQAKPSEGDKVPAPSTSAVAAQIKNFDVPQGSERDARPVVLRMQLVNANPAAKILGVDELPAKSNYFVGNDPKKWHTDVPTYAKIRYEGVYPGVDVVYYGNQGRLEYDFVVAPGGDPEKILLGIVGGEVTLREAPRSSTPSLRLDRNGDLVAISANREVRYGKPVAYQTAADGGKQLVPARFVLKSKQEVGFAVSSYDASKVLVIDPTLIYSTYLAGATNGPCCPYIGDEATAIAVDSSGSAYITGLTMSADFPIITAPGAPGIYQANCKPDNDGCFNVPSNPGYVNAQYAAFITKLSPDGSSPVYSTYIGGSYNDQANAIAVDSSGNAYIAGQTFSPDFPTTTGAYQRVCGPRLEEINGFYCDGSHIVSTCGQPGSGASQDGFVSKLSPDGSSLLYSTFLGGSLNDTLNGIAVDSAGEAYVIGNTLSVYDYHPSGNGCGCPNGPGTCDPRINVAASYGYPITPSGFYPGPLPIPPAVYGQQWPFGPPNAFTLPAASVSAFPWNGPAAAVFSKLSADGSTLFYSTYFGGGFGPVLAGGDQWGSFQTYQPNLGQGATGIAIDSSGDAYVSGYSNASDLCCTAYGGNQYAGIPTTPGVLQPHNASSCYAGGCFHDAFVAKFNPQQSGSSSLIYSTYLGSLADDFATAISVDSAGSAYVSGVANTTSVGSGPNITPSNFPTTPGTLQPNCPGNCNSNYGWVAKLNSAATALDYSTFLSGSTSSNNTPYGIKADSKGNAYVAGQTASTNFPQQNALQGFAGPSNDAFVSVLNPNASSLLFSTFLGGSGANNGATGVALDNSDNIYVTGSTQSSSFPTTTGAFQTTCAKCASGSWGSFVAKISAVGPAPALLTITGNNENQTYGSPTPVLTFTPSGLLNGDTLASLGVSVTCSTTATASSAVGSYPITCSGPAAASNYTITYQAGSLTITPAPLTITASNANRTYGSPNPAFAFTSSGLLNGGSLASIGVSVTCSTTATASSPVGNYPITCTGPASATDYTITYYPGSLTITLVPLTITANNAAKILDAPNPTFTATYSGFVNGDTPASLSGTLNCNSSAMTNSPVGSYSITCSGQSSANYTITYVPGTLKIIYASGGIIDGGPGHQILPPINADGSSVYKQGRTVPAQFRVGDANGVSIGTPGVVSSFYLSAIITGTVTTQVENVVDTNNPDTAFRWDATSQQWLFNITTKNLSAGSTYVYTITLNDGSTILFQFGLR